MIDYNFKSQVLKSGLCNLQKKISKTFYAQYLGKKYCNFAVPMSLKNACECFDYYNNNFPNEWKEAVKINHAYYFRVKRLKDKVKQMLESGDCIFLTFTFTDKILKTTNADTRRQKVRRFLSSYKTDYVANIDFGAKNGREHYHAIIKANKVDYSKYNYGALNGQKIAPTGNDYIKLAKYISKLTNHAIKDTCRGSRIIYNK